MSITDDAIRERHGCSCRVDTGSKSAVTIWEVDDAVAVSACASVRHLTQWEARYLASKLYRLSRRIRQRTDKA